MLVLMLMSMLMSYASVDFFVLSFVLSCANAYVTSEDQALVTRSRNNDVMSVTMATSAGYMPPPPGSKRSYIEAGSTTFRYVMHCSFIKSQPILYTIQAQYIQYYCCIFQYNVAKEKTTLNETGLFRLNYFIQSLAAKIFNGRIKFTILHLNRINVYKI